MPIDYLQKILTAKVYDVAVETPLELAPALSARLSNRVLLKREDQQPVFSFKLRGAYNKMAQMSPWERARGVIAASAGNHAQGVALAAQRLDCTATIVMPVTTPRIKIAAVEARGARVVLHGDSYSDAYDKAQALQKSLGATFVHPYDDPDVIAGQGTVGMEILRQHPRAIDAIFVPVGGGGLISGSALAAHHLAPGCRVIGVEPEAGDDGGRSFRSGRIERVENPQTIADGARTSALGEITFPIVLRLVSDMVAVPDAALIEAMRFVWERMKLVVEPTGVLGLAALTSGAVRLPGERVGVILSGGNVDPAQAAAWL